MYSKLKHHYISWVFIFLSSILYLSFGYDLARENSIKLLGLTAGCFLLCYKLIQIERENFKLLLSAGILFRLLLTAATPVLSQDFYRYIWDGELLISGINPYLFTPNELIESQIGHMPNAAYLYEKMGFLSQKHFSNYPPISQYIYALAAYLGQGSITKAVLVFKIVILLADLGVLFLCRCCMQILKIPSWKAFWYFLNPLVILELSGNLHLEGLMIFLFLGGLYFLLKQKPIAIWAAFLIAAAIMTKLIPILFYPFLLWPLGIKKWFQVGIYIVLFSFLCLWPMLGHGFLDNYLQTIGLWFNNFEFNASFYNLIKSISKAMGNSGYKTILSYGKVLPFLMLGSALLVYLWQLRKSKNTSPSIKKNHFQWALVSMLFFYTVHLFIATTVHPWYLIFGLVLSLFTPYKYFILWSFTVFFSYFTYAHPEFKESLWVLAAEYLSVFAFLTYEIVRIKVSEYISVKNV